MMTRRWKGLLQLVATIDCTASGTQGLEKRMDLWGGIHTAPLQNIGGRVSPSTMLRQTPKRNRTAGIKSGLAQTSALLGAKIYSLLSQDAISKTQPLPA